MKFTTIGAATALLALAACDPTLTTTSDPEVETGPITPSDSISGTYNLRASECGNPASETRLLIEGNRFNFHASSCVVADVADSTVTEVTLACTGEGQTFNRIVKLQTRPGELQMIDDQTTLTYFQCRSEAGTLAPAVEAEAVAAAEAEVSL